MASSQHLARFGEGEMARTYTGTTSVWKQNLRYVRRAHRRSQSSQRRSARAAIRTQERRWFCELPDSPDSSCSAPWTNGSDEDEFDYGAFIDRATAYANQRNQLPLADSSATTESWANGSWYRRAQSWQSDWQNYSWGHSQDQWNPSEYHNLWWIALHRSIIHRTQIDTADTVGEHQDSHNIHPKQFVSFFCCCESRICQHE